MSAMDDLARTRLNGLRDELARKTVAYCWARSDFYRSRMQAAGAEPGDLQSVADLEKREPRFHG